MPRYDGPEALTPSVLDRLLDDEPENEREADRDRWQVLAELKQSVARDLENLLNTRCRCVRFPPDLEQLEVSLANYGIPDFTNVSFGSPDSRKQLRRIVEQAIRKFEPRFTKVQVQLLPHLDPTDRRLRVRIDALLYAQPAPEPVVFASQLEPICGEFAVKSEST